jgi:hypothetical protein
MMTSFCSLLSKHFHKEVAMNNMSDEVIIEAIHTVEKIILRIIDVFDKK